MHFDRLSSTLLSAALTLALSGHAFADASQPVMAGEAAVRLLVAGKDNTNSAPVFRGGIEVVLNPGWKTYWRYPGDAGIPPRFDWSGSENVANVEVLYPAPKRISDGSGQTSIGYESRVTFPLRITAKNPASPVTLRLKMDFATCEKLCIPAQAETALSFSSTASAEPSLDDAEKRVPIRITPKDKPSLAAFEARVERGKAADGSDARILVKVLTTAAGTLDLFAEGPDEKWTLSLPQPLEAKAGKAIFAIPLENSRFGNADVPPKLRLTLVGDEQAFETEIPLD